MIKWYAGIAYLVSILLGNLFVIWFGVVKLILSPVDFTDPASINPWFILTFPAGAVWIGLTFSTRDFAQKFWGHWKVWYWMLGSAVITLFLNWQVALASVAAFLAAEAIDWGIYTIMKKSLQWRVVVSNLVSCPVDSIVFVTIAFGVSVWDPAVWGQALVKYLSGLLVLPLIPWINRLYEKVGNKAS